MTRGLRKIPVCAAMISSFIKHGSSAFAGAADAPDDLEVVDVTFSRHADGQHRAMLFVTSTSFNQPDDIEAMNRGLRVPLWEPQFPRRTSSDLV